MRRILILLLVLAAAACHAEDYTLGPDSQPHAGVPKGTVTQFILPPGRYYPGTPHKCAVYVPAQYDAARPTPFMIFLDGSQALGNGVRAPIVLDNLIAGHDLPPMIAIFIDPGVLPAVSQDDQNRYNRIFEYDSLSDRFAEFLVHELIPEVGRHYNLSKNPDDRGLSGVSTGAVGAFMAAWNRPDQFHRVLSFIGTYVSMKGADSLPALVRKTEPKPIRIFMQDGTGDHIVAAEPFGTSFSGSWPINNQVMHQALEYSGYDVKLVMGTEAHNMKQGGAILPDALRWLWRGYPEPIVVHEPADMHEPGWDPRGKVFATIDLAKPWQPVGGNYGAAISPAADKDGNVYFADAQSHSILKASTEGAARVFLTDTKDVSALCVGADGRLYVAEPAERRIVSYGLEGGAKKIVARDVEVRGLAITRRGSIYFTDATHRTIDMVDAAGRARTVYDGGEIAIPAGIALSPDQSMVVVTDAESRFSWSFQIAADGSLENGEPFYRLEMPEQDWMSHAEAVATDAGGAAYFATPRGIQVCEPSGRVIEILNAPEPSPDAGALNGIAFAGANPTWLYVVQGKRLYRRPVKVAYAPVWAPVKPPKPLL
ncbi:MAG TPA: alpha/beta hydrolase-fold protein [Terracidiphilus sp.]|jgi:sugar lactone lactonase YvrE|nr:alpha/beta hydrolase-fold protein [Terracidiphilus sp.]